MKVCSVIAKIKLMGKKHLPGLHENKRCMQAWWQTLWSIWQQYIYLIPVALLYFKSKHMVLILGFTATSTKLACSSWRLCIGNFEMWNTLTERQESDEQGIVQNILHFWEKVNKADEQLFRNVKHFPRW